MNSDTETTPTDLQRAQLKEIGRLPSFATARSVCALILREMTSTYGRSPGGYIWAFLEPILLIGVMVGIFSLGFRSPPMGTNFAIYYASGVMPFVMFVQTSSRVSQAINYSKQLLGYPRVTFWDAILARFILAILTQLTVSCVIFATILSIWDTRTILLVPTIGASFAMAAGLGLGVGLLNCLLTTRFVMWHTVWSIITRPLILMSGVLLPVDRIPEPYRTWLEWNPVLHVVGTARSGFYTAYDGAYLDPIYTCGFGLVCGFFGLLFLRRHYRDNMER